MKYIMDGKSYNTETATEIGFHQHLYPGDFHYFEETLYKTVKGGWFVSGEGGAASRYAEPEISGGTTGGRGARVLSEQEALDWCEQHFVDTDVIEQHFNIEEG